MSKIGIGSYGIGGRGHRDIGLTEKLDDPIYIDALIYQLELGINFTEISLGYGHGNSLRLFKHALNSSSISREDVILTNSFYPRDLESIDTLQSDVNAFYKVMETDYADSTLVTQSLIRRFGKDVVFPILHELLESGKTRYVSLSNSHPQGVKDFKTEFGDKFFAHEGHLSFEVRALQDNGVLDLCAEQNITNIIWRPLRRNKTAGLGWGLLKELSEKYNKTENQIVLNWMIHLGYYPMIMSAHREHIKQNLDATEFTMDETEYQRMADFRPPGYTPPKVDWEDEKTIASLITVINDFENQFPS